MWFGTVLGGLNKYDGHRFTVYQHQPNEVHSIGDDEIISLYEDQRGVLWVGTGKGLSRFDPKTETFHNYEYDANEDQNGVRAILEFPKGSGKLWLIIGEGLYAFDQESESFRKISPDRQNPRSWFFSLGTRVLYEDRQGIMWVGVEGELSRFDPESENFAPCTAIWRYRGEFDL